MNDAVEADLVLLERALRQLQVDWEKFFGGVDKFPPTDQRSRVEAMIRKYASAEIRNSTLRFRYQGLTARYNVFNELWNKKLRAREEGRPISPRVGPRAAAPSLPPPSAPPAPAAEAIVADAVASVRIEDATRDRGAVERLYQVFLEERRKTGESTAVRFESFEKLIAQQAQRLAAERGAQAIDFRLETRDGKVSLKAKVVR